MLRPARRCLMLLFTALLFISAFVSGQTQPAPASAQPVQMPSPTPAPLVTTLRVIVTSEKDAPVDDLKQADFQVVEDGTPQTITAFAHDEAPVSYVLVMDNTGSMRTLLAQAVRAGEALVAGNQPADETAVVRFVSSNKVKLMQEFTSTSAGVSRALAELYVEEGQSAVLDGVYLSAKYVAARSVGAEQRRRALVLVTDGEDRDSYVKLEELLKYLRGVDVQVFAIGLVQELESQAGFIRRSPREQAAKLLDTLAEETGGRVFYPNKPEQFTAAITTINNQLRKQYVLSYTPSNQTRDGKQRKVQVKLADKPGVGKRTVSTRKSYIVLKDAPDKSK